MKDRPIFPLRREIERLGIKQQDVSLALGISAQYVSKMLNGNASATFPESMREFLSELGLNVPEIERECQRWRDNFKRNLIESKRIANNAKVG
jgi:transcriptional regulator with XRE-family HTH domain